ncbi:MAG: pentapeptide repeat-containing protein [Gammaproteobacteria bacterium]
MTQGPHAIDHPLYRLLLAEDVAGFNARRNAGESLSLKGAMLRGLDLRGLDASGLDLRDACLRGCDLRGIDFRTAQLDGATITEARVNGCYFAGTLAADEIRLALEKGTRLRAAPGR